MMLTGFFRRYQRFISRRCKYIPHARSGTSGPTEFFDIGAPTSAGTGLCGTEARRRRPRRMRQPHPGKQAFYFNFKIARSFRVVFCHSGSFRACPGFLRVFFRIPGTCGKPGGFRRKCPGLRETRRKLRVCPGLGIRFRNRENSGFYAHNNFDVLTKPHNQG
jgi:hypothetical protein